MPSKFASLSSQFQKEKTLAQDNTQATDKPVETATTTAKKRAREVELEC